MLAHAKTTALEPKRNPLKKCYVAILLTILPLILKAASHLSKAVKQENDYLGEGFSFAIAIAPYGIQKAFKLQNKTWKSIPTANSFDFIITFRDLDYAFDAFAGNVTLKNALSSRLFTTHGPNNKGVSITYLFTAILHAFFFWRKAYRKPDALLND